MIGINAICPDHVRVIARCPYSCTNLCPEKPVTEHADDQHDHKADYQHSELFVEAQAAAETAPAPDMPMLDAAAPQAADADEGAAVEKDSAASGIALGLAQCVQIDGVLYFDTGSAVDCPPDRGADGVIETSVDRDAFPETDGCSNFGTGYSYWVTGDGVVVVEIDEAYWEFMAN